MRKKKTEVGINPSQQPQKPDNSDNTSTIHK